MSDFLLSLCSTAGPPPGVPVRPLRPPAPDIILLRPLAGLPAAQLRRGQQARQDCRGEELCCGGGAGGAECYAGGATPLYTQVLPGGSRHLLGDKLTNEQEHWEALSEPEDTGHSGCQHD